MGRTRSLWSGYSDIVDTVPRSPEEFLSARTRALYEWWTSHAAAGGVPLRQDFDIVEHWGLIRHIFLIEAQPDGHFLFRIVGDYVAQLIEKGREGRVIGPDDENENMRRLHAHYGLITRTATPHRLVGRLLFSDKSDRRFEGVDCPLSADGRTVTTIVGVMDLV